MIEISRKVYLRKDVHEATLKYFNGDELATGVWINKYCLKDSDGNLFEKTPEDMHRRLAKEFARIESKYPNPLSEDEIFKTLDRFKRIVPGGSPMGGIGNNNQIVSISNCFVIGNDTDSDSYGGIMKLDQEMVQLQKRRGGVGLDMSFIRPAGTPVKNSAITSTGVVPFMDRYSNSTKEVAQDGRRGALMESISIKHPDAEAFIDAKMTEGKVTGANISVKLDDEFMYAAKNNLSYIQHYPVDWEHFLQDEAAVGFLHDYGDDKLTTNKLYTLGKGFYAKIVDAKKIWEKIIHNAWKKAEPGILFWDNVINESIPDCYDDLGYKTVSTNPCFPSSEYLLTNNGYFKFGDLVTTDIKKTNNVICDNRISYVDDGKSEKPENWKINNNKVGTIIRKASNVFLTQENAEIIEIKTTKGFKLRSTLDHHIATTNGMIEAQHLTPNDNILIPIPNNEGSVIGKKPQTINEMLSVLWGLIQGDGTTEKNRKRLFLDFWGDDKKRMKMFVCNIIDELYNNFGDRKNNKNRKLSKYFISETKNKIRIGSAWLGKIFLEHGFDFRNKFIVPEFILNNSSSDVGKYYVAALMYCDGSIQGSKKSGFTIRLSQSNEDFLNKIQMILHSNGMLFGIYLRRGNKYTELPDGKGGSKKYKTKKQYELISLCGSIVKYRNTIGFLGDKIKEDKSNIEHNFQIKKSFTDTLISVKKFDNEPVYCIKEDIGRNIIVNGISTRRCGEIPLCPNDSCRLLALNLYGYVKKPFQMNAQFDKDVFAKDVQIAQRLMDDIIDLELEKIDAILKKINDDPEDPFIKQYEINLWKNIRKKAENGRRTGLGVTGEGDMLAALGLTYGTDNANIFSEAIHKGLKLNAYRSSVDMAKERGTFPIYNSTREIENPFIKRIADEDFKLYQDMVLFGRRNMALLTIAPTGTVSLMTQTTSGIEPVFLPVYKRRRKINPNDKDARIDFVDDEGITWMEYPVFHHNFETWLNIKGYDVDVVKTMNIEQIDEIIKTSPYYKATSADVDWVKKVEMQGMVQKHVDHSISVTVNLPENVTEKIVANVYETGHKVGCKGITVYREGSRTGVLITDKEKAKKNRMEIFNDNHAPKRPKRLKGDIHRFQNNLEKWIAVVGINNDRPYEIFTGRLQNGLSELPNSLTECEIVKKIIENPDGSRGKRYDLEYFNNSNERIVLEGISHTFNPEYWNYAKMISSVLRHGMPMGFVFELVNSLNLEGDHLNTWKNGVARVIKRYVKDGEKAKGTCLECGSTNLEFKEGCLTCMNCGNSKCG